MNRTVTILCAALVASSCTIMPEPVPVNVIFMGKAPVKVKGGAWDDDCKVGTLDLLVFRSRDGRLLDRSSCTGNLPLEACVPAGEPCRWYIVANAAGCIGDCTTLEEYMQTEFCLQDGPVMHAEGLETFRESGTTVEACLSRFACKVGLGSISVSWTDALPCTLETIALTNVLGTTTPGLSASTAKLNCGEVTEDLSGLIARYPGLEIRDGEPVDLGTSLFCMPSEGTRIALCITAQGHPNWYPIDLPPMEQNHCYLVDNVVINGPGAPGVDQPVERTQAEFSVRVTPWEEKAVPIQL